jgi:delta 1-pyrroline-5-carboxylate dehydrogenase
MERPAGQAGLQDEIADSFLIMLKDASRQLNIGRPDRLAVDIGPGISAVIDLAPALQSALEHVPASVSRRISISNDWSSYDTFEGALIEGAPSRVRAIQKRIASLPGPLVVVQAATSSELSSNPEPYNLYWLEPLRPTDLARLSDPDLECQAKAPGVVRGS